MYFSVIFLFSSCSQEEQPWGTIPAPPKIYDFYPTGDSVGYLFYLNPDGFTDKRYLEISVCVNQEERYSEKTALLTLKKKNGDLKVVVETSESLIIKNFIKYLPFAPESGDTLMLFLYDGIHKPHPDIWLDPPDKKIILELL